MSLFTKFFLVIFAVVCCVQLAQLAPASDQPPSVDDITKQLGDAFQNFIAQVQKLPENEQLKGLGENLKGMLEEGAKKLTENVNELSKNLKSS